VLAAALGRDVANGAFEDLQQGLLHALARNVAGDGHVLSLARDLVNLVNINNPALGALDIVVGVLQEAQHDVLDIFTHITGLGQGGGVRDGKGHVQHAREGPRQQGLSGAGVADEQEIALFNFDVVAFRAGPFLLAARR
jgi:hypothetical protein